MVTFVLLRTVPNAYGYENPGLTVFGINLESVCATNFIVWLIVDPARNIPLDNSGPVAVYIPIGVVGFVMSKMVLMRICPR